MNTKNLNLDFTKLKKINRSIKKVQYNLDTFKNPLLIINWLEVKKYNILNNL